MKFIDLCMKWKFPLFLGIVLSVLYLHFFENRAVVNLDINVSSVSLFKVIIIPLVSHILILPVKKCANLDIVSILL